MTFTGEEISLDIPESGVSLEFGWKIKPLNLKVARCIFIYNNIILCCFYLDTIKSKFL